MNVLLAGARPSTGGTEVDRMDRDQRTESERTGVRGLYIIPSCISVLAYAMGLTFG